MKIVVLDGYTLNPGDLDWAPLAALGELTVYERTAPAQVLERAVTAPLVLTNKVVLNRELLTQLPDLRYIGVLATGYNVVDLAAAAERRIPVTNVPTYGTQAVAQMVFAHILNLTHHVAHHGATVAAGRWSRSIDFCYWDYPLIELEGLTLGIVGCGRIGRRVAEIGRAFGMSTIGFDEYLDPAGVPGIEMLPLEAVFGRSDVLTLHCPLTPSTEHLVNHERLALMKPSAFLINTGRGPLVDQEALAAALATGRLAGAGLDVLAVEPPPPDNPLLAVANCCVTPHLAWATRAARDRLLTTVCANVAAFLAGRPQNVVNGL